MATKNSDGLPGEEAASMVRALTWELSLSLPAQWDADSLRVLVVHPVERVHNRSALGT